MACRLVLVSNAGHHTHSSASAVHRRSGCPSVHLRSVLDPEYAAAVVPSLRFLHAGLGCLWTPRLCTLVGAVTEHAQPSICAYHVGKWTSWQPGLTRSAISHASTYMRSAQLVDGSVDAINAVMYTTTGLETITRCCVTTSARSIHPPRALSELEQAGKVNWRGNDHCGE